MSILVEHLILKQYHFTTPAKPESDIIIIIMKRIIVHFLVHISPCAPMDWRYFDLLLFELTQSTRTKWNMYSLWPYCISFVEHVVGML